MEIWKDVTGYEGSYQVSNHGRVKSLDRLVNRNLKDGSIQTFKSKGKILTNRVHSNGYRNVQLSGKNYYIHRLVAEAFIENPGKEPTVNHKDGDKTNNHLDNLEWCSYSDNHKHASVVLGHRMGEKNPMVKLTDKQVEFIKDNYIRYNKEFGIAALARKFDVCYQTISNIVNGHSRITD